MYNVVIVEDEELVRRGIVTAVNWASVDCAVVGEAAGGTEGIAVIRSSHPDIVVTDIRMPGMDGLEMLRRLREEGCEAKFILLTAYSDFAYAQTAVKLGASDYLLKPFHDGELEAAVARIIEKSQPRSGRARGCSEYQKPLCHRSGPVHGLAPERPGYVRRRGSPSARAERGPP